MSIFKKSKITKKEITKEIRLDLDSLEEYDEDGFLFKGYCNYKGGVFSYILDVRKAESFEEQVAEKILLSL